MCTFALQTYTYLGYLERPKKSAYVCGSFSLRIVKNVNASCTTDHHLILYDISKREGSNEKTS